MTSKKRRFRLGKRIRLETGLPLPVCMRAAKLIDRGDSLDIIYGNLTIFSGVTATSYFSCGPDCCGPEGYKLVGPRGEFRFY